MYLAIYIPPPRRRDDELEIVFEQTKGMRTPPDESILHRFSSGIYNKSSNGGEREREKKGRIKEGARY
jgi:hypothetical protein